MCASLRSGSGNETNPGMDISMYSYLRVAVSVTLSTFNLVCVVLDSNRQQSTIHYNNYTGLKNKNAKNEFCMQNDKLYAAHSDLINRNKTNQSTQKTNKQTKKESS